MVKVRVSTFGSVSSEAGWGRYKELHLAQETATVEDALKSARLKDGRCLFDLVIDNSNIKGTYSVLLNGMNLLDQRDLRRELKDNDVVTVLDYFRTPIGG